MDRDHHPVRLLVAGPGLIGRKHIALIGERADAELVGIVGPAKERHQAFAAELRLPHFDDVGSAIDALEVDGIIIASPNGCHLDQARQALERGVAALIEKPLASTLADARSIVDISAAAGVPVLVGHHRTYNPLVTAARAFIGSAEFGSPVALQGSALFYKPSDYFTAAPWRTQAGGGPLLINLIHEIGLWRSFFGEIDSASAMVSASVRGFEVEDSAAIALSFRNGALGSFILSDTAASSKSWEMTTGENPAYPYFPDEICYHLAGTSGSLDFPSMHTRTYAGQPERSWWSPFRDGDVKVEAADPLVLQLAHFIDVVRGKAAPMVSAMDGYSNMLVLEAVARSAELGRKVPVGEIAE